MTETTAPPAARPVRLVVNGVPTTLELEPRVSLLDALREDLHLTGTKKGCNQGACGACTVLVDGRRIVSCLALAVQYNGRAVTTIEGVGPHPLQDAFVRFDGLQCGYCTPGQICSAIGMLEEHDRGAPSAVTDDVAGPTPLTRNEIHHLLNTLVLRPVVDLRELLRWSTWRRRHQYRARISHYLRRAELET